MLVLEVLWEDCLRDIGSISRGNGSQYFNSVWAFQFQGLFNCQCWWWVTSGLAGIKCNLVEWDCLSSSQTCSSMLMRKRLPVLDLLNTLLSIRADHISENWRRYKRVQERATFFFRKRHLQGLNSSISLRSSDFLWLFFFPWQIAWSNISQPLGLSKFDVSVWCHRKTYHLGSSITIELSEAFISLSTQYIAITTVLFSNAGSRPSKRWSCDLHMIALALDQLLHWTFGRTYFV